MVSAEEIPTAARVRRKFARVGRGRLGQLDQFTGHPPDRLRAHLPGQLARVRRLGRDLAHPPIEMPASALTNN
jgi:hypothetical protein